VSGQPAGGTTSSPTLNTVYFYPFYLDTAETLSAMSVQVTTGGSSGSVCRFGIYNDNAGQPGTVLLDAGTAASTGIGACTKGSLSQALAANTPYWAAFVPQVAASPVVRNAGAILGLTPTVNPDTLAHALAPTNYFGYLEASVTGAFATAASLVLLSATGPLLVLSF
jgi:hypothetical protein